MKLQEAHAQMWFDVDSMWQVVVVNYRQTIRSHKFLSLKAVYVVTLSLRKPCANVCNLELMSNSSVMSVCIIYDLMLQVSKDIQRIGFVFLKLLYHSPIPV
jgi:hypothetical protein